MEGKAIYTPEIDRQIERERARERAQERERERERRGGGGGGTWVMNKLELGKRLA